MQFDVETKRPRLGRAGAVRTVVASIVSNSAGSFKSVATDLQVNRTGFSWSLLGSACGQARRFGGGLFAPRGFYPIGSDAVGARCPSYELDEGFKAIFLEFDYISLYKRDVV